MEPESPSAGAPETRAQGAIIGVGNTLCGDDGAGPAVARHVHELLEDREDWDLVELCCSAMEVVERLAGYRRAVVIDALVDWDAPPGTVFRVAFSGDDADLSPPSHAVGLATALGLARAAGLPLPEKLLLYGIAVKGPFVFGEDLSAPLRARIGEIAQQIARDLLTESDGRQDPLVRPA